MECSYIISKCWLVLNYKFFSASLISSVQLETESLLETETGRPWWIFNCKLPVDAALIRWWLYVHRNCLLVGAFRWIYAVKMWFVLFLLIQIVSVFAELPHHKFEYKYSFKGPYLAQKDGTVPFWEHFGSKYNLVLFPAALVHVSF